MNSTLNVKTVLGVIFKVTQKNANILADCYLLKDKSIISKWKSNSVIPKNDDIARIVDFTCCESTITQQKIMRDSIEEIIENAPIKNELKDIVLATDSFRDFLQEVLSVAVSIDSSEPVSQNIPLSNPKNNAQDGNVITGQIENKNGRYKGTLEFDLVIPEMNSAMSSSPLSKPSIEFNGKVNLSNKNRLIKVAKYLRTTSVLGVVLLCIISGTYITYSNGNQRNDYTVYSSKQAEPHNEISFAASSVTNTPTPTLMPSPVPTSTPVITPKKEAESKPINNAQVQGNQNQTVNKTTTKVSNKTTNNSVHINGDGNLFFQGDNNAISIDIN